MLTTEVEVHATQDELEARRYQVARLRLRRMSESQIARELGVSEATISRDLAWVRMQHQALYGANPVFNVAEEIGEAIALYADVEATALLASETVGLSVAAKMRALVTAMAARMQRVALLADMGLLARPVGGTNVGIPTPAQIRHALKSVDFDPNEAATAPPRKRL